MTYLSVENFWKYQNADVWKKSKTHPPWFKHYVHRDRELDRLPPVARLLFWELVGAATRYHNVLGSGLSDSEANLWESEADLSWIWAETRVEVEDIREWLPKLIQGGWLSQTKTPRRSRKPSRESLEDPRDQDIDVDEDKEKSFTGKPKEPNRQPKWCDHCSTGFLTAHDLEHHITQEHNNVIPLAKGAA